MPVRNPPLPRSVPSLTLRKHEMLARSADQVDLPDTTIALITALLHYMQASKAGLAGIRSFRRDLFTSKDPTIVEVLKASDSLSASMF